jgi:formylmethanofuran dehydrogenase subunit E
MKAGHAMDSVDLENPVRLRDTEAQICTECGELTARSGSDSLYCKECGAGPFCDACYIAHGGAHIEAQSTA